MRSLSPDSRKPRRALGLAVASLLLGSAVQAADPAHKFVLTVYSDGAGGEHLIDRDYAAAAQALHHHVASTPLDARTSSNNRCVTLALTKQWDAARAACDLAVREAQLERASVHDYHRYWTRSEKDDVVAIALANRAVVHWLSADTAAATDDLQQAESLSPTADCVVRNRAALEYWRTTVAQAVHAPAGSQ